MASAFVGSSFACGHARSRNACVSSRTSAFIGFSGSERCELAGTGTRTCPQMGLFGLGFPELLVIGGAAALVFGPSKLGELGKSLGGVAGGVKKATSEFQEAMQESINEADREIAARKTQAESPSALKSAELKSTEVEVSPAAEDKPKSS